MSYLRLKGTGLFVFQERPATKVRETISHQEPFDRLNTYYKEVSATETRIALIGIVVNSNTHIDELNHLLSQYAAYIIGRMGIPYREKGISIISVAIDAPNDVISALSGKLGMLPGISTKTIYAKTNA